MQKVLDKKLGLKYKNNSQKIRVMSELWTEKNIFCPNCGNKIYNFENNKPVADFHCKKCLEEFELKSKSGKIGKKILAGAYSKMIERLNSDDKPNFFFLGYLDNYTVNDFFVIPKYFFVSEIIEKRKALSDKAKRAGWVGSNILFSEIPNSGKIYYIENGKEFSEKEILKKWKKTTFIKKIKKEELKGWIFDILNCIGSLKKAEFNLEEICEFEEDLKFLHPENNNIKAKIRQQLQFLRDKNYLEFLNEGKYRIK